MYIYISFCKESEIFLINKCVFNTIFESNALFMALKLIYIYIYIHTHIYIYTYIYISCILTTYYMWCANGICYSQVKLS